jgi:hypothetical protein
MKQQRSKGDKRWILKERSKVEGIQERYGRNKRSVICGGREEEED